MRWERTHRNIRVMSDLEPPTAVLNSLAQDTDDQGAQEKGPASVVLGQCDVAAKQIRWLPIFHRGILTDAPAQDYGQSPYPTTRPSPVDAWP